MLYMVLLLGVSALVGVGLGLSVMMCVALFKGAH